MSSFIEPLSRIELSIGELASRLLTQISVAMIVNHVRDDFIRIHNAKCLIKDGWLKMKAAGFTFSEKQIKVKITQEPSAASMAAPVAVAKKKSTITCVKGKTIKKVSAVSPKCPAGFKKKA